jgi:preprotein translocase subunit SecE
MDDGKPQESVLASVASWPSRLKEYYQDLKAEMRRVTWPTRQQVYSTTAVVIGTVFVFAAYFWVVDLLLGRVITRLFETLTRR